MNDVLVAFFKASSGISYSTATLLHSSFFSAYILVSIPVGIYLRRHGYRRALTLALFLMALGALLCVPALAIQSFPMCLAGIFVIACGIAALQTSANPCISLLGPDASATARLLLVQTFQSVGSMAGPLTGLVLFGAPSLGTSSLKLRFPGQTVAGVYAFVGTLLIALGLLVRLRLDDSSLLLRPADRVIQWKLLRLPRLRFALIATFLFIGSEATLLAYAIPYLSQHDRGGFLPARAASLLSVYWFTVLCGRLGAARLLKTTATRNVLQGSCLLGMVLVLVAICGTGSIAAVCLLCTGLGNAAIFPAIFTLSVTGLHEGQLPHASAFLSMALCGGGAMPVLSGLLAERFGIPAAFFLPLLSYVLIGAFAVIYLPREHRLKQERAIRVA